MSIWGNLVGGFIGFSFAGPIGALIGSVIGGKISSARRGGFQQSFAQSQQIFAISLVILTAKLAKADGHVSKEELIAIKQKLKVPDNEIDQVGKIFNKAKEDSLGYEPYAKQIAQIYQNKPAVLDEVINILFYIAEADGKVSNSELAMIKNIAQIFNLTDIQFEGIKESRKGSDKLNPYIVLGCTSKDDFATIRKKYLQLSKEHHPDALISKGVPKEVIEEKEDGDYLDIGFNGTLGWGSNWGGGGAGNYYANIDVSQLDITGTGAWELYAHNSAFSVSSFSMDVVLNNLNMPAPATLALLAVAGFTTRRRRS